MDRVRHWLACGAQPSETVNSLLKKAAPAQTRSQLMLILPFAVTPKKAPELCGLSGLGGEADMKDLVEMIAKALVDNPEQVLGNRS